MFAILTEHWGGKWPLWISPRQCMVVPISGEEGGANCCSSKRQGFRPAGVQGPTLHSMAWEVDKRNVNRGHRQMLFFNKGIIVYPRCAEAVYDYGHQVRRKLRAAGLHVDIDVADRKMQKKVGGCLSAYFDASSLSNPIHNLKVRHGSAAAVPHSVPAAHCVRAGA